MPLFKSIIEVVSSTLAFALLSYTGVASARFLQSDPIGLQGGLNTYSYALNNPLYWVDPLGLDTWPANSGTVTSVFGPRPNPLNPTQQQNHRGIDIRNPSSQPVYNPRDGVVTNISPTSTGANRIKVVYPDGVMCEFLHTAPSVGLHNKVSEGQVLGMSDGSGNVTGPHLHMECRRCPACPKEDPRDVLGIKPLSCKP